VCVCEVCVCVYVCVCMCVCVCVTCVAVCFKINRWADHVARMGERSGAYSTLFDKREGKNYLKT